MFRPDLPVGLWFLDEASGAVVMNALDSSATRDGIGTINGGVTLSRSGPLGSRVAITTNGTNGYVNLGIWNDFLVSSSQPQSFTLAVFLPSGLSSGTTGVTPFGTNTGNVYVLGLGSTTGNLTNEVVSIGNGSGRRVGWAGFTLPAGWHVFTVTYGGASDTDWTCFINGRDAVADLGGSFISAGGGCPGFTTHNFFLGRFASTYSAVTVSAAAIFDRRLTGPRAKAHADAILYG